MKANSSRGRLAAVVLVILAGLAHQVCGQVNVWNNTNPGTFKWETGANWSLNIPPASGQSVFITNFVNSMVGSRFRTEQIDSTTVGSPSTMTVSNVTVSGVGSGIGASHNSLFLNNAGTNVTLIVQDSMTINANGAMTITNSSLFVQKNLFIDNGVFLNTGELNTDSKLCSLFCFPEGALTVIGHNVPGSLNMTAGHWNSGPVQVGSSATAFGTLAISGGSVTMEGSFANTLAPLNVVNGIVRLMGGDLNINDGAQIGTAVGETGQMIVSNATWTDNSTVLIGAGGGTGSLTVESGTLNQSQFFVGDGANSLGAIEVDGGLVNISDLHLGQDSVGQMTVSNGTIYSDTVYLGYNSGSAGTLTVAGGDFNVSTWMYISPSDCSLTGIVTITGGSLNVTNSAGTAFLQVNSGTLELDGGTLRVDTLILTNCAHFVHTGGTLIYSNAVLDANGDADGDGIPNGYEQAHGLNPFDPSDAALDRDGDGMSNLQEYLAGTDATNSASYLHITAIARTNNDVRITWMMGPGRTNALQATTAASGGYNTNGFTAIFTVTNTVGSITNFLDVGGATNKPARYYRIRLVP